MTALDGLGSVTASAMQPCAHMAGERDDCGHRFHIRLVMVSNDRVGRDVCTGQGLPKKGFRTGPIPFVSQKHINDLPVFIYCTIQVQFSFAPKAEYFVDGPVLPHPPPVHTEPAASWGPNVCTQLSTVRAEDINMTLG